MEMGYMDIRQRLLTALIIVQAWQIAWTHICRQHNVKWYCLYVGEVTWADAQTYCKERQGRLAWDHTAAPNAVLHELIITSTVSQAWIGGKTGPLYWNWMNKDLRTESIYYQGCYSSRHVQTSKCTYKGSKYDCKIYCNGSKYFSYHMESSSRVCCCFNIFGMMDGGSYGHCSTCDHGSMPCGDDSTQRAIYMTSARFPEKHIWQMHHPGGLTGNHVDALGLAVVFNYMGSETKMEERFCTEHHYPLCILDKRKAYSWQRPTCRQHEFNMGSAGKCLAYIAEDVIWGTAVDKCKNHSPERNSVLSSFASYAHFRDLELVMGNIVYASERQVFWTFGSSRRWVWEDEDTFKRQDIEYVRWDNDDAQFPQKGHCILLNETAKWTSRRCDVESAGFICESDEKPTIPTTGVLTTVLKTETPKRSIDTTLNEQETTSGPHWSEHITSFRPFTTEYSGPDSEPQSADPIIPVIAGLGSVVGLIILTAAVVLIVCWRKRRRMTDKGSGTGNVTVGFSAATGVDLHNQSDYVYNDVDHGDYTTIAGTGNHTDMTENVDCTGEHVYESALGSGLPNIVKGHIQNTSPEGIVMNDPDRGVRRSKKNVDVKPNLNPVTETPGDVSVLYSVPKKDMKKRPQKNQPESNPIMAKRAEEHKQERQTNLSQTSDQGTECAVYAVPKKRSKRSEVTADGNTPDSVYAYAAVGFAEENVNENTENADYYNLIISQKQQRNMEGSPSDDVEDATTLG